MSSTACCKLEGDLRTSEAQKTIRAQVELVLPSYRPNFMQKSVLNRKLRSLISENHCKFCYKTSPSNVMLLACDLCQADSCAEYETKVIEESAERPVISATEVGVFEAALCEEHLFSPDELCKVRDIRHMKIDHEITRGIPLHRALQYSELWTSPDEIRRRKHGDQVWTLSTRVSSFDIFLSHTWRTKGRWKALSLMIQNGWLHGLLGWFTGLAMMLCLRAFDVIDDPWHDVVFVVAGKPIMISLTPYTVFLSEVSMMMALFFLAPYLPFKKHMCFLDIACIHQEDQDLFERGISGIGGCLAVAKELRVLYSPEYLSSLWCWFELVGFRKANPEGKLVFLPLFIERSAALCVLITCFCALSVNVVWTYAEVRFRQAFVVLFFCLPFVFMVHTMRQNYRDKARLIFDLNNFDINKLTCASDFDRAFILNAIDAWYGSIEIFTDFVRTDLREELQSLLPSPHLPCAYAALIISGPTAWALDASLSVYKAGASVHDLLRFFACYVPYYVAWFWFGFNAIFYLSDRTSSFGRTRVLDCCKTVAVTGATMLWFFAGFGLLLTLVRSTGTGALVGYLAFSALLPLLILDVFKCRCPKLTAHANR